jgi:hypothetical protein
MAVLFGMPALFGITIQNFIGDALVGTFGPWSLNIWNFVSVYWIYKLISDPSLRTKRSVVEFVIGCVFFQVFGWLHFILLVMLTGVIPMEVVPFYFTAMMAMSLPAVVISPLLVRLLYPVAKKWKLVDEDVGFLPEIKE